jgi:hypothetical protein
MRYDWDPQKRRANLVKHKVDFAAVEAFDWSAARIEADIRHDEVRLKATGAIAGRVHVLIYTVERRVVRVISLRKASAREVRRHAEASQN